MSALALAHRLRGIEGSPTLALAAKAKALAQAGESVVDFTAGEPDFPTPRSIQEAGIRAITANQTRYTPVAGIPELRRAVAESVNRRRGTAYTAAQTIVTCGAKHALFNIFQALCQAGDEVVILSPYWVSFPALVRLSGATPVIVPTQEATGFQPDVAAIREAISNATKAIIVNSPCNPTGSVVTRDRLKALAHLADGRGIVIVSDEIYDQLVYAPAEHVSIVQVAPRLVDQIVLVGGVSKSYRKTGCRIAYALGPEPVIEAMITLQSHSTSNPTSISQQAALEALTGDQAPVEAMRREFQTRRDRLVRGLNALKGCRATVPQGAFYAWCNVQRLGQPAERIASRWLEEAQVAVVPGEGFGSADHIRFSFATSMEMIEEGLRRLAQWVATNNSSLRWRIE